MTVILAIVFIFAKWTPSRHPPMVRRATDSGRGHGMKDRRRQIHAINERARTAESRKVQTRVRCCVSLCAEGTSATVSAWRAHDQFWRAKHQAQHRNVSNLAANRQAQRRDCRRDAAPRRDDVGVRQQPLSARPAQARRRAIASFVVSLRQGRRWASIRVPSWPSWNPMRWISTHRGRRRRRG